MDTTKLNMPAIYSMPDRWVAVDPANGGDFGCEIEYKVTGEGVFHILDVRYTNKKGYIWYGS